MATHNLDAVLSSTDSFRYRAATTGVWSDLLRNTTGVLSRLTGGSPKGPAVKDVLDPSGVALENLLDLAESDEGSEAWRNNEKVRTFTRYATSAPSQLCRERAVLELVSHARRLGVDTPYVAPAAAANQAELRQVLEGLVDATRGIIAERSDVSETARIDFEAAIEVLESTEVDVQGGSRLLRAIGPFVKGGKESTGLPRAQRERLEGLSLSVQAKLVREALHSGVVDRSDAVRSAGMTANIAVYGEAFAIEALIALIPRKNVPDPVSEAHDRFGVPQVPVAFDRTYLTVFEIFERDGLPFAAKKPNALGVETRGTLFAALWQIAISDMMFDDRVRHGAMRALNSMSGAHLDTLRAEEWDEWFRGVAPGLERELRSLRAAENEAAEAVAESAAALDAATSADSPNA